jgi:hypothetical protein
MTMTQSGARYAPGYDLFKLIVTIVLAAILFILMLRGCAPKPAPAATPTATLTATETVVPSMTMTLQPTSSPTLTFTPMPTTNPNDCPSADTRIKVGDKAKVLYRLNFRSGPGLEWPILFTNAPGATMDVIGGPTCTPMRTRMGSGAYLWWNLRMPDGREGWSAEASLLGQYYFLEPQP